MSLTLVKAPSPLHWPEVANTDVKTVLQTAVISCQLRSNTAGMSMGDKLICLVLCYWTAQKRSRHALVAVWKREHTHRMCPENRSSRPPHPIRQNKQAPRETRKSVWQGSRWANLRNPWIKTIYLVRGCNYVNSGSSSLRLFLDISAEEGIVKENGKETVGLGEESKENQLLKPIIFNKEQIFCEHNHEIKCILYIVKSININLFVMQVKNKALRTFSDGHSRMVRKRNSGSASYYFTRWSTVLKEEGLVRDWHSNKSSLGEKLFFGHPIIFKILAA